MGEVIEVAQDWAMILLPENTVKAEINVEVYDNDKGIIECQQSLNISDVRDAFRRACNYIDEDDVFALTDFGRKTLGESVET